MGVSLRDTKIISNRGRREEERKREEIYTAKNAKGSMGENNKMEQPEEHNEDEGGRTQAPSP